MSDSEESIGGGAHSNAAGGEPRVVQVRRYLLALVRSVTLTQRPAALCLPLPRCFGLLGRAGWSAVLLVGCATAPPPPPPPAPEVNEVVPSLAPYPFSRVYTAEPGALIRGDSTAAAAKVERAFVSLNVLGRDTLGLVVRCPDCEPPSEGWIGEDEVVHTAVAPDAAALGSLGEFALAISTAAAERDLEALRPVMALDFFFSFVGMQNPDAAFAVWQAEDFASLDQLPALLSEGLGTADGTIWAAPRAYVETLGYRGLRLGFRKRPDGRWEWLYLVRGVTA